ncbi:hypothetical protein ACFYZB_34030 [Streptomyces sp. NPDC001852]|uniref:hypothetical protein n=1 Tax=Streptomyces sp. NPDC001852 TaxID=3364619 RepID=UPI0036C1DED3
MIGGGLLGGGEGALYDRIIATCAVQTVPRAWLEQIRPGGQILTTIGGWLSASELVRLTVHEDGTASGPVLGGQVRFMLARPYLTLPLGLLPDLGRGRECGAVIGPDVLDDWTSRFVAQVAVPNTQRLKLRRDQHDEDLLVDVETGSFGALHKENGHWSVRNDGPDLLWDAVEEHLGRWHTAGTPAVEEATVHVTPEGQSIH